MGKIIEIEVTQEMIDDLNRTRRELGLPETKDVPHKMKCIFG